MLRTGLLHPQPAPCCTIAPAPPLHCLFKLLSAAQASQGPPARHCPPGCANGRRWCSSGSRARRQRCPPCSRTVSQPSTAQPSGLPSRPSRQAIWGPVHLAGLLDSTARGLGPCRGTHAACAAILPSLDSQPPPLPALAHGWVCSCRQATTRPMGRRATAKRRRRRRGGRWPPRGCKCALGPLCPLRCALLLLPLLLLLLLLLCVGKPACLTVVLLHSAPKSAEPKQHRAERALPCGAWPPWARRRRWRSP